MSKTWFTLKAYKDMKIKYEQEYFKLGGDYAWFDGDKLTKKSITQIREYFKNKQISKESIDEETGNLTTKYRSFYSIWSEDPDMREYIEVIHTLNKKNRKAISI